MPSPVDPPAKQAQRPAWADAAVDARSLAQQPDAVLPDQRSTWRADLPVARRLVRHTLSIGALVSGLLEYTGWQIAQRAGARVDVFPIAEWAQGAARNLGGAAGIGLGLACIVLLVPSFRKRPLRAASAAFAFGVAGFLAFLSFLVSMAP